MGDSWARAWAARWGLPPAAVDELERVVVPRDGEVLALDESLVPLAASAPATPRLRPSDRYDDLGLIKLGGMGEVRRVWDLSLHRTVAMKVLRQDLADRDDLVLRFVEEAQATGQLEHPGVVPIYDIGELEDGRPYFTMKEIRGRTLLDVIEEVHQASDEGWRSAESGWTFARMVDVFQSVCRAVAYAHSRGVLHRDLKPTNVMLGEFGEVVVMDWGLAKIAGVPEIRARAEASQVITTRSAGNLYATVAGSIAGTPNYMAPEQARGDAGMMGVWSDVYALGALLYEILADRAPYQGQDHDEVVAEVLRAAPPPPYPRFQRPGRATPEDGLRAICVRAMARDPAERFPDAATLADAVSAWVDQATARDRAVGLVREADALEPELQDLRRTVATLRAEAAAKLAALPANASTADKREAWAIEDQAVELEQGFGRKQARYVELLRAALDVVPDLPAAHTRLHHATDLTGASRATGHGWISLVTEPPGADVTVRRFESVGRRLVPAPYPDIRGPLHTPVQGLSLPAGAYQLRIRAPGFAPVTVLARVEPGEVWSTVPAGTTRPKPIVLPRRGAAPDGTVWIPMGWSWFGGDIEVADALPRSRAWVEGVFMQRHPVTNRDYRAFLRALVAGDRARFAEAFAPGGWKVVEGRVRPAEVDLPWAPVRRVTFEGAQAYARWWSRQTQRAWRLPREREWERAARGVDERLFPWGNHLEASWACIAASHGGRAPGPAPIAAFPWDVSPFGVRGLGGNVRDWVIGDGAPRSGEVAPEHRWVRGGHYLGIPQFARAALRYQIATHADKAVGFRLVCPVVPEAPV